MSANHSTDGPTTGTDVRNLGQTSAIGVVFNVSNTSTAADPYNDIRGVLLSNQPDGLTVKEIASLTGINPITVRRKLDSIGAIVSGAQKLEGRGRSPKRWTLPE